MKSKMSVGLAAVFALAPAPVAAQAETKDEIQQALDWTWNYQIPNFDECVSGHRLDDLCGKHVARIVCSLNGLILVTGENDLMGSFTRQINGLTKEVSRNADYIEALVDRGLMENPGDMPRAQMRRYCRGEGVGATDWGY